MFSISMIEECDEARDKCAEHFNKLKINCRIYSSSLEFLNSWRGTQHGLYFVNLALRNVSSFDIVQFIRKCDPLSPIYIILPQSVYPQEELDNLISSGADGYFSSPLNFELLSKYISNVQTRWSFTKELNVNSGIKLIEAGKTLVVDGEYHSLTNREFGIMKLLLENPNSPVSRENIAHQITKRTISDRSVDVHVFLLRKKIKKTGLSIETIRGYGYKLGAA